MSLDKEVQFQKLSGSASRLDSTWRAAVCTVFVMCSRTRTRVLLLAKLRLESNFLYFLYPKLLLRSKLNYSYVLTATCYIIVTIDIPLNSMIEKMLLKLENAIEKQMYTIEFLPKKQ